MKQEKQTSTDWQNFVAVLCKVWESLEPNPNRQQIYDELLDKLKLFIDNCKDEDDANDKAN